MPVCIHVDRAGCADTERDAGCPLSPVRRLPSPRVRQIDGLPQFRGALPVELKDLAHHRLEVVETRTLAALGDQLGVGADRQAERTVVCF